MSIDAASDHIISQPDSETPPQLEKPVRGRFDNVDMSTVKPALPDASHSW